MRHTKTFGLALVMAAGMVPACGQPPSGNDGDMSSMNQMDGSNNPPPDMSGMMSGNDLSQNAVCSAFNAEMPSTMPVETFMCTDVFMYNWLFNNGQREHPQDESTKSCFRIGFYVANTGAATSFWTCSSSYYCWQNCGPGHVGTCYRMAFNMSCTHLEVAGYSAGLDPAKDQPDLPTSSAGRQ